MPYSVPIAILLRVGVLCLACVLLPRHSVAQELPAYEEAKVALTRLLEDENRATYRHNWLKLADSFLAIYEQNPGWGNRPAALFRSAISLEEMARRSYVRKDANDAALRFEMLARKHPGSVLADDALYRAALIRYELMRDVEDARALLQKIVKNYPRADFCQQASVYLAKLDGGNVASLGALPAQLVRPVSNLARLTGINAQLRNGKVRIVISIDRPISWRIKYHQPETQNGLPPRLVLELNDTSPDKNLSVNELFNNISPFTRYTLNTSSDDGRTGIQFDFSDICHYTVKAEREPFRIIIEATDKDNLLTGGVSIRPPGANPAVNPLPPVAPSAARVAVSPNLAAQLGLGIKTIIIDPGHGGRDPGTMHNNIIEREISLDISNRLAKVLRASGYKVILTREKDVFMSLSDRAAFAATQNGDLFISIHVNANTATDVHGFETYYLDLSNSKGVIHLAAVENAGANRRLGEMEKILTELLLGARMQESQKLATCVQERVLSHLRRSGYNTTNGGTKGAPFHVLVGSSMPGVLIEVGYCSNLTEAKLLRQSAYRDKLAEGIANGIQNYAEYLASASK